MFSWYVCNTRNNEIKKWLAFYSVTRRQIKLFNFAEVKNTTNIYVNTLCICIKHVYIEYWIQFHINYSIFCRKKWKKLFNFINIYYFFFHVCSFFKKLYIIGLWSKRVVEWWQKSAIVESMNCLLYWEKRDKTKN